MTLDQSAIEFARVIVISKAPLESKAQVMLFVALLLEQSD